MVQINNIQLRNLTEQVQRNKEDIKYILTEGRQFDEFGIKVVGQVATVEELPDPTEYHTQHGDDSYGDAYMVGSTTPYTLYILTREFSGTTGPHWFNVGEFPLQGPKGDKGVPGHSPDVSIQNGNWYIDGVDSGKSAEGLKGDTGNGIASIAKTSTSGLTDTYTITFTNGTTTKYNVQNGAQGPRGLTGTPGNAVSIIGVINSEDELPTPTESIRNNAYLLNKGNNVYDMYIILGESTLVWTNVGEFNSGTQVTVGGSNVATFDADSKLDKVSGSSHRYQVYGTGNDAEGSFKMWSLVNYPVNGAIPLLNPRQTITIDPAFNFSALMDNDAVNKKYVDTVVATKQDIITSNNTLLDIGLYGNNSYISNNGSGIINIVSDNGVEIDAISDNGEIRIQGTPTSTIRVHNQACGINITPTGILLGSVDNFGDVNTTMPHILINADGVTITGLIS